MKDFFKQKISELKERMKECQSGSGKQQLMAAVLDEVIVTVERQLHQMEFFRDSEADAEPLKYDPLTKSGCEQNLQNYMITG